MIFLAAGGYTLSALLLVHGATSGLMYACPAAGSKPTHVPPLPFPLPPHPYIWGQHHTTESHHQIPPLPYASHVIVQC
ncbi:hypothetical protein BBK36DRAFT_1136750 [Trichoderma citrinoviride]|uniref:Secreted protein n=1 Tax=Trichoderma citrinoviride TaxID=58853 RepID=A0A2T4AWW5_9HYPO|nr:hypothetical protein BBK36DRAFT_1136750 [Trichoderma citrinoviride]PTB61555.1 hypothetical protein BBK36DRAFT_1136750 [Trichoderma citrinoviride]